MKLEEKIAEITHAIKKIDISDPISILLLTKQITPLKKAHKQLQKTHSDFIKKHESMASANANRLDGLSKKVHSLESLLPKQSSQNIDEAPLQSALCL